MGHVDSSIQLQCQCGAVEGAAHNISPQSGNHVVCCCCDCQAFANHLDKNTFKQDDSNSSILVSDTTTLDEFGGTELFQTSQSQVTISKGLDKIVCLRLTPKGVTRWYTSCCNTPVGNTLNRKMPFVGIIHTFIVQDKHLETKLGPVHAYVQTQYALNEPNYPKHYAKFPIGITLRVIAKVLSWKVKGMGKPSIFYTESGQASVKPIIISEQ